MRRRGRDRYRPAQARESSGDILPPFLHAVAEVQIGELAKLWEQLGATALSAYGISMDHLIPTRAAIAREARTGMAQLAVALRGAL